MNLNDLKRPFPPDAVKWRVGSTNQVTSRGMALAYIDARDVMDRLDEVCGVANWQSRFDAIGGRVVCSIGIDVPENETWVWKSDGAGDTDFEPEKGGLSDAFKRAAVQWGIGRYLYDIPAPWVAIEPAGKSFRIKESERPKLDALLRSRGAPQDARDDAAASDIPAAAPTGSEAPSRPNMRPPFSAERIEQFKRRVAAIENFGDLATLDAWFHKNGEMRFGVHAHEIGMMIQGKAEELRGAK